MRSINSLSCVRILLALLVLTFSLTSARPALAGPPEVVLHTFNSYADGEDPVAGLIQGDDGSFYGTTANGGANNDGTVFKLTGSGTLTTLHSFTGSDGAYPFAGVIQGSDGDLYGTTTQGGASSDGAVFKLSADGTTFSILHSFNGKDGAFPITTLIQDSNGNLYGIADQGGANSVGTVFKLSANGTTFTLLHSFSGADGSFPNDLILGKAGNLFGTTEEGANGYGLVFMLSTNGKIFKNLYSFIETDGHYPNGLIQGKDGNLYGTTEKGGADDYGTVFKLSVTGTTFKTLHSFSGITDGADPYAAPIQAFDGNLYGTAYTGGLNSSGTVFKLNTSGTTFTVLHSFAGTDGTNPNAGVIQGSDGNLYGTTYGGGTGTYSFGTVFELSVNGATFNSLYSFNGSPTDGANPGSSIIEGPDGNLYGTTEIGGIPPETNTNVAGTIFQLQTQIPPTPPILLSFTPAKVKVGSAVTVTGLNLANATSVTINGVVQTITSDAAKSLKFKVTTGTPTGTIVVTTPLGSGSSSTQLVID